MLASRAVRTLNHTIVRTVSTTGSAVALSEDLERTTCVVGQAPQISSTVPSLVRNGLAVEALSVTPSTGFIAGSALKARLAAQDAADGLRAKLSLYPNSKGLMPISCLAPEAVHSSDDFQYTIISGPTWWRHELASLSLRSGKDVVVAPPRTAAEATELFELAAFEARDLVLYNDLRFVPAVSELREVLLGGKGGEGGGGDGGGDGDGDRGEGLGVVGGLLGPSSELRMSLLLAPPYCCSAGHPTAEERNAPDGWWRSRMRGGGALGAAGVQAFELVEHLLGTPAAAVRASSSLIKPNEEPNEEVSTQSKVATVSAEGASGNDGASDYAPDYCRLFVKTTSGARADLTLDWRADTPALQPLLRVDGRDGSASLCLQSGHLEVRSTGTVTGTEQASQVRVLRSVAGGGNLLEEAHAALALALMSAQAEGTDAAQLLGSDWGGSVLRSFAAVDAALASCDAGGGVWHDVIVV